MGKSKKRIIHKGKYDQISTLSRAEAVETAVELLTSDRIKAYSIITLFGLSAEELLESGASYEMIKGIENFL